MSESSPSNESERVFEDLVRAAHAHGPIEALDPADRHAHALGLFRVTAHLVGLQQRVLIPLLIRRQELIGGALDRTAEPPLGLGLEENHSYALHQLQLEPGDQVLLYTDGVVEARGPDGGMFGLERFVEFIIRATAGDERAPETLRRLIQGLRDHQEGRFSDDATIMLIQWRPDTRFHGEDSGPAEI